MNPTSRQSNILASGAAFALLGLLVPMMAQAQWTSQTFTLRGGWNSVYLEVQPEPSECDTLFAAMPMVESVWRFNRRQAVVQFIADPNTLVPSQPDWLTWLPPTHPLAQRSSLFLLEGGRPYLIKLADNASTTTWTVHGVPVMRRPEWLADSHNFVGFPLPTNNLPTFQRFFTNSAALATNNIFRLSASGTWTRLTSPATTPMQRGEAFWIRSSGLPDFSGPLEVETDRRVGLDFGRILTEQTVRIRNSSTNQSCTVVLRQLDSDTVPANSGSPAKAGSVPLSWWQNDFARTNVGWTHLSAEPLQAALGPGATWELRLAVRRSDMVSASIPSGFTEVLYQSLLEVTDAENSTRILVPVMAEGLQSAGGGEAAARLMRSPQPPAVHPRAGLWIGSVSITNVSQPSSANPMEPVPTASEFEFRVMVHVDAIGYARLLQRVLQMWKQGQTNNAGEVTEEGRYVLLTDEGRVAQYTGAAMRDGKLVGRRFSTAAFSFLAPLAMSGAGDFGADSAVFLCSVTNLFNSELSPFKHRFHPDHDNLSDRGESLTVETNSAAGPYTTESWTIVRDLELRFQGQPPDGLALSGWGDTQVGGSYVETLKGLHASALKVQGTFRLHQASRVPVLNDGL